MDGGIGVDGQRLLMGLSGLVAEDNNIDNEDKDGEDEYDKDMELFYFLDCTGRLFSTKIERCLSPSPPVT